MAGKTSTTEVSLAGRAALVALRAYKIVLSPVFQFAGARCRHAPACSDYAAEAIRRHGAMRGFVLALARLQRCRPWGSSGFDPVPEMLDDHGWRLWRYGNWKGPRDPQPEIGTDKP
jgi:putative membrane protein insertion efficiency factor